MNDFMIGKCFFVLCALSLVFGAACGNITEVSNAALDGAAASVELTLTLVGNMCLWCGIMEVLRRAGAIRLLSRMLSPLLRRIFPDAWRKGTASDEMTTALCANMLGIANAATPLALEAMAKLDAENSVPERATDDMVTFAVLGASSVNLLPTTLVALRRSAGSAAPFRIIVPIWICSATCAALGVILSKLSAKTTK